MISLLLSLLETQTLWIVVEVIFCSAEAFTNSLIHHLNVNTLNSADHYLFLWKLVVPAECLWAAVMRLEAAGWRSDLWSLFWTSPVKIMASGCSEVEESFFLSVKTEMWSFSSITVVVLLLVLKKKIWALLLLTTARLTRIQPKNTF